jgi:hypothetical protein
MGIEITDVKAPHRPRGEPILLTQAHELAAPKRQISQDDLSIRRLQATRGYYI